MEVVDGEALEHDCLYVQEEYDPLAFKQTFMNRAATSSGSVATPTQPQPRPSYFTSSQGRLPPPPSQDTQMPSDPAGGMTQSPQTHHYAQEPQYQQGHPASPQYHQQHGPQPQMYYTAGGSRCTCSSLNPSRRFSA
jgi:hypothetical protein